MQSSIPNYDFKYIASDDGSYKTARFGPTTLEYENLVDPLSGRRSNETKNSFIPNMRTQIDHNHQSTLPARRTNSNEKALLPNHRIDENSFTSPRKKLNKTEKTSVPNEYLFELPDVRSNENTLLPNRIHEQANTMSEGKSNQNENILLPMEHLYEIPNRRLNDQCNSGLNLSSIESFRRRGTTKHYDWRARYIKIFKHLFKLDISLKYIEIILLSLCISLFSNEIHQKINTFNTIIVPMAVFVVFLVTTLFVTFCMIFKLRISSMFMISINTLAVLLTSISGGIILGVWLNLPTKIKTVLYWESLAIFSQMIFSFISGVIYVIDLTWSLYSFYT